MSDIYDNVLRSIINDCSRFVLPFINEACGEHYKGNEKIVFHPNEHIITRTDEATDKRITDTCFTVIGEDDTEKNYHLECESGEYSSSMLIRLFEYDAQIALDQRKLGKTEIEVTFPHTAVLYLKNRGTIPREMEVTIRVPGDRKVSYTVPVIRMRDYTAEELFEKKLYLMIPFYLFNFRNKFERCNKDPEELKKLLDEIRYVADKLRSLAVSGELDPFEAKTIAELLRKVTDALARKYSKVKKGVDEIMRGPVIETEARRILNEGIALGETRGLAIGETNARLQMAKNMLLSNEPDDKITLYSGVSSDALARLKAELLKN